MDADGQHLPEDMEKLLMAQEEIPEHWSLEQEIWTNPHPGNPGSATRLQERFLSLVSAF